MHKSYFFELSKEDILRGLCYFYDSHALKHAPKSDKMTAFAYDSNLQYLALYWLDSDQDMNVMRLKYHDEIAKLPEYGDWMDMVRA